MKVMLFNKTGSDYNITIDGVSHRIGDRETGGPFDRDKFGPGTEYLISTGMLDTTPVVEEKKPKDKAKE